MKGVNGKLIFNVGDELISLKSVENLILLDDSETGLFEVNQMVTAQCVDNIISSEMKSHKYSGRIKGIKVYDENNKLIAYSDDSQGNGDLKFKVSKFNYK